MFQRSKIQHGIVQEKQYDLYKAPAADMRLHTVCPYIFIWREDLSQLSKTNLVSLRDKNRKIKSGPTNFSTKYLKRFNIVPGLNKYLYKYLS